MEEKEDDFTFCQVERNLVSDVDGIKINDEVSNSDGSNRDSGILWKEKLPSKQQDKFGSLAFNVIDASPSPSPSSSSLSSSESSKQVANADAGTSVKNLQEQKVSTRKPAARTKVPFEKGYSQMDWLKLTRTHPDVAGLKGQSNKRLITMDEVKKNRTGDSMWTVLKGRVYNLSPYMKFHPGGVDMLMKAVGKDCTSLFNKYHAWVNAEFLLEKCLVGMLDDSR